MHPAIDSLDRLVDLIEEKGGRVGASEAARHLFAAARRPRGWRARCFTRSSPNTFGSAGARRSSRASLEQALNP